MYLTKLRLRLCDCDSVHLSEPSATAVSAEERLNQEAEELEKRLSLLSHNTGAKGFKRKIKKIN